MPRSSTELSETQAKPLCTGSLGQLRGIWAELRNGVRAENTLDRFPPPRVKYSTAMTTEDRFLAGPTIPHQFLFFSSENICPLLRSSKVSAEY